MRRYDIVSGILFILSIIGFALAAPVLVQEKRQACVDVVHIPKDVMTVLGKRGVEELEKLAEEYFKSIRKTVEPSDAHALSSSAPPGPDHGSTDVVQAPAPNPASSTANPDPLMEPSSTAPPKQGSWEDRFSAAWDDIIFSNKGDDELHGPLYTPSSTASGLDHELTGAHASQPNPKKRPLTDPDPNFDWDFWLNYDDPRPPTRRPAPPKEFDLAHEYLVEHVQQPNPGSLTAPDFRWKSLNDLLQPKPASPKESGQAHVQQPSPGPSTDTDFDWNHWYNVVNHEDPIPLKIPPPKEFGQAHSGPPTNLDFDFISLEDLLPQRPASPKESGQAHVQQPSPGPSADPNFDWNYWNRVVNDEDQPPRPGWSKPSDAGPSNAVPSNTVPSNTGPSNTGHSDTGPSHTGLPTEPEPELQSGHQSSSTDPQPEDDDRQAAIYAAKGKAKESRRISGTARDVGNGAQKELQSCEW